MNFKHLLYDRKNGLAKVVINNPEKRNALHLELRYELIDLFAGLRDDDDVKAVLLTGAGGHFSSGGDIQTMEGVTAVAGRRRLKTGQRLVRAMVELEKPIVTAVRGFAAGAGASIALASDFIIASEEARFSLGFVRIGLVPDWGLFYFLPLRIGLTRAKELMMTGDPIKAPEAERIGLINKVVPDDKLDEEAEAWAARFASGPGQALAMIKMALNRLPTSLEALMEMESTMQSVAFTSDDFDEGRRSFLEKRKPDFKGK
ncbi:MAG: enoyl-CoA hydratase/isomerase family protein [Proteobacteria bacterium]|nr:enoyl-CoA hydratase/isomerase family protein [Pseudomonadota bacterium]